MNGVAARYPAFDEQSQSITDLTGRIMLYQARTPFEAGSDEYMALEHYLMERARGLLIEVPAIRALMSTT